MLDIRQWLSWFFDNIYFLFLGRLHLFFLFFSLLINHLAWLLSYDLCWGVFLSGTVVTAPSVVIDLLWISDAQEALTIRTVLTLDSNIHRLSTIDLAYRASTAFFNSLIFLFFWEAEKVEELLFFLLITALTLANFITNNTLSESWLGLNHDFAIFLDTGVANLVQTRFASIEKGSFIVVGASMALLLFLHCKFLPLPSYLL